jgi:RNA polymerase sigma-70 factor (ECF subfamily)
MMLVADIREQLSLVRGAIGGNGEARDRLLEHLYGRLYRFHRKLLRGDALIAEELAQETLMRVLRSFDQVRDPERFLAWAFRIATNVWRDHHRRRGTPPRMVAEEEPSEPPEESEMSRRVIDELSQLPELYRVALTLRYLEGLDYEAMAEILETPIPTLRSQIARGRQMIRKQIEGMP